MSTFLLIKYCNLCFIFRNLPFKKITGQFSHICISHNNNDNTLHFPFSPVPRTVGWVPLLLHLQYNHVYNAYLPRDT